jgi:hypothetical protein
VAALAFNKTRGAPTFGRKPRPQRHTMTNRKVKSGTIDVKALLAEDGEFLRALARAGLANIADLGLAAGEFTVYERGRVDRASPKFAKN